MEINELFLSSLMDSPYFSGLLIVQGILLCFFGWVAFRLLVASSVGIITAGLAYQHSILFFETVPWVGLVLSLFAGVALSVGAYITLKSVGGLFVSLLVGTLLGKALIHLSGFETSAWIDLGILLAVILITVALQKLTISFSTALVGSLLILYGLNELFSLNLLEQAFGPSVSVSQEQRYIFWVSTLSLVVFSAFSQLFVAHRIVGGTRVSHQQG